MIKRTVQLGMVVLAVAGVSQIAHAQIASVTGQVTILPAPPTSVVEEALESNTTAYVFQEHASLLLPSNIGVDASLPGTYTSAGSLTPATLPAGILVQSYFLHSDTVNERHHEYIGTITFAQPILGVQVLKATLNAYDPLLGAPGTLYPTTGARGLEFGNPDHFSISADGKTLWFRFNTFGAVDQMRIFTAVPEPGSMLVLGAGLASLLRLRQRRKA